MSCRYFLLRAVADARLSLLEDAKVFQHWAALLSKVNQGVAQLTPSEGTKAQQRLTDLIFATVPSRLVLEAVQVLVDRVQGDYHDNAATLLALSTFLQTASSEAAAEARR